MDHDRPQRPVVVETSEFLDRVKLAIQATARQPSAFQPGASQPGASQPGASQPGASQPGSSRPGVVESPETHDQASPVDLSALAAIVASQQAVEPRLPRVAVPTGAWNTLAADSVAAGLRQLTHLDRPDRLFDRALIEPTHLTPLSMTAAAALALRPGELAPWRMRATSLHHDPRAVPGLDKAGVMVGVAFAGPGTPLVEPTGDPDRVRLSGLELITHAHLYDALLVRLPEPHGAATCYLIPIHTSAGQPNRVRVEKLFGRSGTAPASFARVHIDGAIAVRVGPVGGGDALMRPTVERLRSDAALVGAAQMRAAVDVLTHGFERRTGADVFQRQHVADVEATVGAAMAMEASARLTSNGVGGPTLVLAQHWIRSRFGTAAPDASALMQLAGRPVAPAVAWTSPLLPLWGGTAPVLRSEFVAWADRGALAPFLDRLAFESGSRVLRNVRSWLGKVALDTGSPPATRLESAALVWAAAILTDLGRTDALGVLLGASGAPRRVPSPRRSGGGNDDHARSNDSHDSPRVVVDLRSGQTSDAAPAPDSASSAAIDR